MANSPKNIKNTYLRRLMEQRGWGTLLEVHLATGIALTTLSRYADNQPKEGMKSIIEEAAAVGVEPGEWLNGITGHMKDIASPKVRVV